MRPDLHTVRAAAAVTRVFQIVGACLALLTPLACVAGPDPVTHIYEDPEGELRPFYSAKMQVTWKIPTNSLPTRLRVLHPIRHQFSPQTVTNLLALIGLTPDQKPWTDPETEALQTKLGHVVFQSGEKVCHLTGDGTVHLSDGDMKLSGRSGHVMLPLPDNDKLAEITRRLLPLFELPPNEFDRGENGGVRIDFGITTFPERLANGALVTVTNSVYTRIKRRFEGLEFDVPHHLDITVRRGGRIETIDLRWPRVKTGRLLRPPSVEHLTGFIRSGQARCLPSLGKGQEHIRTSDITRFTIDEVKFSWVDKFWKNWSGTSTSQIPMARLHGTAELANGRKLKVSVMCPATKDLPVSSRKQDTEVPAFPR